MADSYDTGNPAPAFSRERVEVESRADFSRREFALRELMDEPCTFAEYRAAALDLAKVNWLTRGSAPTLRFLERVIAQRGVGHEPLRVLDVGSASGDTLRRVAGWADRRSVPVRLTGVDINPYAARLAREQDRAQGVAAGRVAWVTADAFAVPMGQAPDVIVSSLFTHHLDDAAIVRFLAWSEQTARVGWMVNDLERSERAAVWFGRLAAVLRWHRFVRYDGPVSFRRALSRSDWAERLREAQVQGAQVYGVRPGRLCVERIKR